MAKKIVRVLKTPTDPAVRARIGALNDAALKLCRARALTELLRETDFDCISSGSLDTNFSTIINLIADAEAHIGLGYPEPEVVHG